MDFNCVFLVQVYHEHTSQIQDFFSTYIQFQDFSGPEKSKLKFQDFSGPVGTLTIVTSATILSKLRCY